MVVSGTTDKSSPCVGQNHLPSCQQGEACHHEEGTSLSLFHFISLIIDSCSD